MVRVAHSESFFPTGFYFLRAICINSYLTQKYRSGPIGLGSLYVGLSVRQFFFVNSITPEFNGFMMSSNDRYGPIYLLFSIEFD